MVVPAFNAAKTIRRALDSLRGQTLQDLEIIVVDDGSSDLTVKVVEENIKQDARIRLIRHSKNLGTFHARLTGIQESRGEYVTFVDADDYITREAYEQLVGKLEQAGADILIFGAYQEDAAGNRKIKVSFPSERLYESELLERFACLAFGTGTMWNKLYRRSVLEEPRFAEVRKRLVTNEDYLYNIACFARARKVLTVPDIYYFYCETPGGSSSTSSRAAAFVLLLENFADALEVFSKSDERVLDATVQLYRHQLQMSYCRAETTRELVPFRPRLTLALQRIGQARPEFIHDFSQGQMAQPAGVRAAGRLLLRELKIRFSGR